jgi:hypothetical protein
MTLAGDVGLTWFCDLVWQLCFIGEVRIGWINDDGSLFSATLIGACMISGAKGFRNLFLKIVAS